MSFRSTSTSAIFQKTISQQGKVGEHLLRSAGYSSSGKLKLQFVSGRQKAADYVKMLNDSCLAQEGRRENGGEWIFRQDKAAIHNSSVTKKYLLKQKIRLLRVLSRPQS